MIHESGSKAYAGTVELTSIADEFLNEMYGGNLSIGSKIGFCEVFVGDNEGQIPYFHIKSKSVKWECYIEIDISPTDLKLGNLILSNVRF